MSEREIGEVISAIKGLDRRIDDLVIAFGQHTHDEKETIEKIDARTAELEKWHWRIVGGGAVAAFFMPIVTSVGTALAIQAITN